MNIEITSLIGSILAVTVSVTFAVTFKISLNNFKTEVNQRLTNIETKINMINEKKIENSGTNNGIMGDDNNQDNSVMCECCHGMYTAL